MSQTFARKVDYIDLEATNYSLRASAAIRVYHAGVDEQLMSEVTGQRLDEIRNYKWTTSTQKETWDNSRQR